MAKQPEFEMPPVTTGDIVDWYPNGQKNADPLPALVNKVGARTVSLSVFQEYQFNMDLKPGVRHVDDPNTATDDRMVSGLWDFRAKDKATDARIRALENRLEELATSLGVGELVDATSTLPN